MLFIFHSSCFRKKLRENRQFCDARLSSWRIAYVGKNCAHEYANAWKLLQDASFQFEISTYATFCPIYLANFQGLLLKKTLMSSSKTLQDCQKSCVISKEQEEVCIQLSTFHLLFFLLRLY